MNQSILGGLTAEQRTELAKLLPDGQQSSEFLYKNVLSPQFQQAVNALEEAVNSYECADIFRSFNIYDEEIFKTAKTRKLISCRGICEDDDKKVW